MNANPHPENVAVVLANHGIRYTAQIADVVERYADAQSPRELDRAYDVATQVFSAAGVCESDATRILAQCRRARVGRPMGSKEEPSFLPA